jgi:hypothetical protein
MTRTSSGCAGQHQGAEPDVRAPALRTSAPTPPGASALSHDGAAQTGAHRNVGRGRNARTHDMRGPRAGGSAWYAHTQAPHLGGREVDLHAHPGAVCGREARLPQRGRAAEQRCAGAGAETGGGGRRTQAERRGRGRQEGACAAHEAQKQQRGPHRVLRHTQRRERHARRTHAHASRHAHKFRSRCRARSAARRARATRQRQAPALRCRGPTQRPRAARGSDDPPLRSAASSANGV